MKDRKILLPEDQMPKSWYNIMADLPTPRESSLTPCDP